jgi:hypothetical protein
VISLGRSHSSQDCLSSVRLPDSVRPTDYDAHLFAFAILSLQVLSFGGRDFHTGYQSGVQANPFFEITGDGTITQFATPEPASLLLLGLGWPRG